LIVEGYHAAPLYDVAATVIAHDAEAQASDVEQFRISTGYSTVISELALGIEPSRCHIELGSRVRQIDWSSQGVRLDVQAGASSHEVRARKCLITVSIGVLQALPEEGGIAIRPRPHTLRRDLAGLAMGHIVKVVLRFQTPIWPNEGALSDATFLHVPGAPFPTIWHQNREGMEQITAWGGGPEARALSHESSEQICDLALARVGLALGIHPRRCERALIEAHFADFTCNPLTQGAYSYVRPGGADAPKRLSEPLEDTLFFAGEALDRQYPATVAGAIGSGQHAARRILASCRRAA
jgi:monoamine oxidase